MACGDVLSLEDFQTAKKHQIFEAEVITGKAGGVAGGANIGTATNPVTGQTQQTMPSILADLGFDVQSWTSSTGGVLASANHVFLNDTPGSLGLGDYYAWGGAFPKTVPAGTDPALPASGYIMRSSRFAGTQAREALRRSYAESGRNLVDGSFEAGGTLVNVNDVLLQERTGRVFSGPAGTVDAGTNPASGGFVDVSSKLLRTEVVGPVRIFKASQYDLTTDTTADNTAATLQMMADAQAHVGYFEIDLQGGMYRVYAGSNLNPLRLVGKRFKIKNGGFYAANASVSPTVVNFPSAITFDQCDYTAENFTCYAKGEKWGNTDASSGLDSNGRANWIAENGGHAIAVIRSKYVHINVNGGLAGSVASIYFPSSRGYSYGGNSYCASLGYAPYNADTWCGSPPDVGIGDFVHVVDASNAVATEHRRPEDGVVVGVSAYCGKLGYLAEGAAGLDVQVYIQGGRWVGFYANGASMDLGAAFAATSATLIASDPIIGDAAAVIRCGNSSNTKATCRVINAQAKKIGLTGVMVSNQSFGSVEAYLSGDIEIVSDKTWPTSGVPELVNSSIVANRGVSITVNVEIDATVTGNAKRFIHNFRACYGGVKISGGDYTVSQYVAFSKGWGGSGAGSRKGFVCSGKPIFRVTSTTDTDEIFHWQDVDDSSVGVYVYIDAENAAFISSLLRRVDFVSSTNPARREKVLFPRTLDTCYALAADRPREVIEAEAISSGGASGANWSYKFAFPQGKPPLFPCMVALNDEIRLVLSGAGSPSIESGKLVQSVFLQGAPSSTAIAVGGIYGLNGA